MRHIQPEDLRRAASMLVASGLRIGAGERFVVIADQGSLAIQAALEGAARDAGAQVTSLRLDELRSQSTNHPGTRPHRVMPDGVRRPLLGAQASAFVASALPDEIAMREQLRHVVSACGIRHADMAGVRPSVFAIGLEGDLDQIHDAGRGLARRLETCIELTSESHAGTRLAVRPGRTRWTTRLGRVSAGMSVAFPAGWLSAAPESVTGTFVADAGVGASLAGSGAVAFDIDAGRVRAVRSDDAARVRAVETILEAGKDSDRVGLVVLGVNAAIVDATGEPLVDLLRPGLHLVFGPPDDEAALVACQAHGTVRMDGTPVMIDGHLALT